MSHSLTTLRANAVDRPAEVHSSKESGLAQVSEALEGIRYGEVRVIVQDGVIVQIERLEKYRLR